MMKYDYSIIVCNSVDEYNKCFDKAKRFFIYTDHYMVWNKVKKTELKKHGFPIYLIFDGLMIDWCIDKTCENCNCKKECDGFKKIQATDYLNDFREKKIKRVLKE